MYELIPITGLRGIRREVDDAWKRFFDGALIPLEREETGFVPSVDFKETEKAYEVAAEEAEASGKSFAHHVLHLSVHGTLHLLGYDHEDDREALLMEAKETLILQDLGIPAPYDEAP